MMKRRDLMLATAAALQWPLVSRAQSWATKPVRLVLGAPAGTAPDIAARVLGEKLAALWMQPVVIENRPGAGGTFAMEVVKASMPDGHTLTFVHSGAVSVTPRFLKAARYDPIADFAALGMVAHSPLMIVASLQAPGTTLAEILVTAKAQPGKLAIGSTEQATFPYLIGREIAQLSGTSFLHVPFSQPGQAMQALATGDVQYTIDGAAPLMPLVKAGRVRAVAVTSDRTMAGLEGIPLVLDTLPGYGVVGWFGLQGPRGLPAELARRINGELNQALASPDVARRFQDSYLYPAPRTQAETLDFFKAEVERWGKALLKAGIEPV